MNTHSSEFSEADTLSLLNFVTNELNKKSTDRKVHTPIKEQITAKMNDILNLVKTWSNLKDIIEGLKNDNKIGDLDLTELMKNQEESGRSPLEQETINHVIQLLEWIN